MAARLPYQQLVCSFRGFDVVLVCDALELISKFGVLPEVAAGPVACEAIPDVFLLGPFGHILRNECVAMLTMCFVRVMMPAVPDDV